jgi:energy-coupling factor transporter ATP-binding protein EcfA2
MYQRLIVFCDGRIAADGNPEEILSNKKLCVECGLEFDFESNRKIVLPSFNSDSAYRQLLSSLDLRRLSFDYPGGKTLIKNISATFERKQITAVVGPSGCGKSTLAMLLSGILEPDSGEINYCSESGEALEKTEIKGRITAALQQPERQFFLNSCREEISFGPDNLGTKLDKDKVRELFHLSGLSFEQFADRDPLMLSLGEKRRLAFSALLALNPDFMIFDEPTCALDPEGVGRFILLTESLKESGLGIIVITHDQELVNRLADRVISMDGRGNYRLLSRTEEPDEKEIPA